MFLQPQTEVSAYFQTGFKNMLSFLQIFSTMGEGPKPPDEVDKLLKLYLEWILFSESAAHIQMGHFQVNSQSLKKNGYSE